MVLGVESTVIGEVIVLMGYGAFWNYLTSSLINPQENIFLPWHRPYILLFEVRAERTRLFIDDIDLFSNVLLPPQLVWQTCIPRHLVRGT